MSTNEPVYVDGFFHGRRSRSDGDREMNGSLRWDINSSNTRVVLTVGRNRRQITFSNEASARLLRFITSELEAELRAEEFRNDIRPPLWLAKHLAEEPAPPPRFCPSCLGIGVNEHGEPCPWCDDGVISAAPDQS